MKSKQLMIIIAVVVVVVIAAAALLFTSSAYSGYSSAFNKTTKSGAMEYNTGVKATMDGTTKTATGNMKIQNLGKSDVKFINTLDINGQEIKQYTDGAYIYQDDGQTQTKYKVGSKPPMPEKPGDFNMEYYVQEFSSLLDASKLKELNIADKTAQNYVKKITKKSSGGETEYDITLASQLVQDLANAAINSAGDDSSQANPTISKVNSFTYTAMENSSKYINKIIYTADFDMVFPAALTGGSDETKNIKLELTLDIVNPGQTVTVSLPADLSNYQELS